MRRERRSESRKPRQGRYAGGYVTPRGSRGDSRLRESLRTELGDGPYRVRERTDAREDE